MTRLQRDCFERVVREHHAAVYRAAHRLLRNPDAAADVAQEVFLRVLEGKTSIGEAAAPRAVLCWLAARLASNHLRSRRRRRLHEERAMNDPRAASPASHDPAAAVAAADLHQTVQELVCALPTELQLPLQMRCQDELTLAAIGTALRVPESTVHDRVQQALRRVRDGLAGRGYAVALGGVPELVATVDPVVPPGGLEARLLSIVTAPAAVAPLLKVAVVALALGLATGAGVLVHGWGVQPPDAARPVAAAGAAGMAPDSQEPTSGAGGTERAPGAVADLSLAPADAPPTSAAVFAGTVHDAAAWPVAGARIEAVAAGGLKAFELGATTTDHDGSFRLELEPTWLAPSHVRLRVLEAGHLLLETDELSLPRPAEAAPLVLVLRPELGTATNRFELRVAVRGNDGAPLAGVPVRLLSAAAQLPLDVGNAEASGTTGGDGIAVLIGRALGSKRLFVDGRGSGWQSHAGEVDVPRPGGHDVAVQLARGRAVDVRVGGFGGVPVEWANVWLEDAATGLQHPGARGADGTFRCTGLGDGDYTLHVWPPYDVSPYQRSGVRAEDGAIDVVLKPRTETRDVGDHMAELHGELVDATTGAVVPFRGFDVGIQPWRPGESTLSADRLVWTSVAQQKEASGSSTAFCEVGLAPGRHALVASVDGYAPTVVEFDLGAGELRSGLRVPLHRGGEIRGCVFGADGRPAAGARLFLVGFGSLADEVLAGWLATGDRPIAGRSGADGTFRLTNLPPGVPMRLAAESGNAVGVVPLPAVVSRGAIEGVAVYLRPR